MMKEKKILLALNLYIDYVIEKCDDGEFNEELIYTIIEECMEILNYLGYSSKFEVDGVYKVNVGDKE